MSLHLLPSKSYEEMCGACLICTIWYRGLGYGVHVKGVLVGILYKVLPSWVQGTIALAMYGHMD